MESVAAYLLLWALGTLRVFAFLYIIPFLRGALGVVVTVTLALALSAHALAYRTDVVSLLELLRPLLAGGPGGGAGAVLLLAFREIAIGVLVGLPFAVVVEAFQQAARLIDVTRGTQYGEQINPLLGTEVSALEGLMSVLIGAALFASGAYRSVLAVLQRSIELEGIGVARLPSFATAEQLRSYESELLQLIFQTLESAILWAFPVIILSLLLDTLGGCLSRFLGRIGVVVDVLAVKVCLALFLVAVILPELSASAERFSGSAFNPTRRIGFRGEELNGYEFAIAGLSR
jgi:type III secretion protein T